MCSSPAFAFSPFAFLFMKKTRKKRLPREKRRDLGRETESVVASDCLSVGLKLKSISKLVNRKQSRDENRSA